MSSLPLALQLDDLNGRLEHERADYSASLASLLEERDRLKLALAAHEARIAVLNTEKDELEEMIRRLREQLHAALAECDQLRAALIRSETLIGKQKEEIQEIVFSFEYMEEENITLKTELSVLHETVSRMQSETQDLDGEIKELRARLAKCMCQGRDLSLPITIDVWTPSRTKLRIRNLKRCVVSVTPVGSGPPLQMLMCVCVCVCFGWWQRWTRSARSGPVCVSTSSFPACSAISSCRATRASWSRSPTTRAC